MSEKIVGNDFGLGQREGKWPGKLRTVENCTFQKIIDTN
jgi:hypothetical protein